MMVISTPFFRCENNKNIKYGGIIDSDTGVSHLAFFQVQFIRFCYTYHGHIFGCQLMGL